MMKIANNFKINRGTSKLTEYHILKIKELLDDDEWSSCPAKYGKQQL